jgi:hypothetical protein
LLNLCNAAETFFAIGGKFSGIARKKGFSFVRFNERIEDSPPDRSDGRIARRNSTGAVLASLTYDGGL